MEATRSGEELQPSELLGFDADNVHVEQKNWTHVRQLLGHERLEYPSVVATINALYRECWEPLHNYFLPSAKLEEKKPRGGQTQAQARQAADPL